MTDKSFIFLQKTRNSLTAKIMLIGLVVLLCQIPVLMVDGLISRRQNLARDVECEIASKWDTAKKFPDRCSPSR